jgi:hypothetical protein
MNKLDMVSCTCHPRYSGGIGKRTAFQVTLDESMRPYLEKI